jgi:hypothetical protein
MVSGMFIAPASASDAFKSKGQTVYIPVYSHIYSGDRERRFYLTATLSIRNIDPSQSILISAVDYYDSDGKIIKHYLTQPLELPPIASTRFVVKESDKAGGSGANFIVTWKASQMVNSPILEAVMVSTQMSQGISFISRGRVIAD